MLAHGILGLFVGPIILAVTWELMMAWIREERSDAAATGARTEHEKRSPSTPERRAHPYVIARGTKAGPLDLCQWSPSAARNPDARAASCEGCEHVYRQAATSA